MKEVVRDAAIGWLVQSVLGIIAEKLGVWIHGVGLADDVESLKSEVQYVQMVHAAAKGRKIENEPLAQSLGHLKELLYDAEDVVDELDYYRLQEQVTRPSGSATSSTGLSSSLKAFGSTLFSKWGNIIYVGRKRKREDDTNIAACKHLITNISEFSQSIQDIARKLREVGNDVSDALKIDGSKFVATSDLNQSILHDTRLTSSYLVEHKVYGRDAQKDSILKLMMTSDRSTDITVLPIIGIGGVGKTTLAQLVYNDLEVKSQFKIKIWVCVSNNFNVTRLSREMLDCVSKLRQADTNNLNKLQEDLEKEMESQRFLIVLDDVWDDMNKHSWNKLLAPLQSNKAMGNMILVTTRKLCVAEITGTVEPVKLGALEWNDLWPLFKSCAFGDGKYEQYPSLHIVGKQIAQELRGNPLAAKTVGALLKRNMTIDNWTNILHNEEWKSLKDSAGIMPALKLSYDYLPDHLQQCFRYCCLFPKDYYFDRVDMVRMWISQGFVHGGYTGKKLEDTGNNYFIDLVDSGFFELALKWEDDNFVNTFVMHDLVHDLALEVSRAEFATIDGSEYAEILPTVRHLSIVISSSNHGGLDGDGYFLSRKHGDGFPCVSYVRRLEQVKSVRKLRSLMLIGNYDSCFFKCFQNMFKGAQNLRLLYMTTTFADFGTFISNLVSCAHIRYLKMGVASGIYFQDIPLGVLPQALINFFHLQVLDVYGIPTLPSGVNSLFNLQHLFARQEVHSTISSIGNMVALQELPKFKVQNASGFDIRQLKSMNQLVQLGVYQLENVRSKQEATDARLIDKGHLEDLVLSWDAGSASSGTSQETSTEVLEGLKPHEKLKHLQIIGYNGSLSPSWLTTDLSVTCLQSVHLENCKEWRVLPPLEKLPFLRKLKLINLGDVVEAEIPCSESVLIELPRLKKCVFTDRKGLSPGLRSLFISKCYELEDFQIQNFCSFEVEQNLSMSSLEGTSAEQMGWLSGLLELTIHECPRLRVLPPMPPTANTQLSIESQGLSTHPTIKVDRSSELRVGSTDVLRVLGSKILAFQNLRSIKSLHIEHCPNLASLSCEGFRQLLNLRELIIIGCGNLVSSCTMPSAASEGWKATECPALANLTRLKIVLCGGIAGKWLTEMLPHMQSLVQLDLMGCPQIKSVSIHPHGQVAESASLASDSGCQTCLTHDEFHLHIPSNVLPTLNRLHIQSCVQMQLCSNTEGFGGFTSLTRVGISDCPKLFSFFDGRLSLLPFPELWIEGLPSRLQPDFTENQTSLKKMVVQRSPDLQSLSLQSCTALEELKINSCSQLAVLEGVQYLRSLVNLEIEMNPELSAAWIRTCQGQEEVLPLSLEELHIVDLREGAMPSLVGAHLPSLSRLEVVNSPNLTSLQLGSLTTLKSLEIVSCESLGSLEGLQSLGNLTDLLVSCCYGMSPGLGLMSSQQAEGSLLLPRLERLRIDDLAVLTPFFCKNLTSLRCLKITSPFCSMAAGMICSGLTDEQDEALQLLTSLQELRFVDCEDLVHLPAALHGFSSLKKLFIGYSPCISLPESGLPPSLEQLVLYNCTVELRRQCTILATDKLEVETY